MNEEALESKELALESKELAVQNADDAKTPNTISKDVWEACVGKWFAPTPTRSSFAESFIRTNLDNYASILEEADLEKLEARIHAMLLEKRGK